MPRIKTTRKSAKLHSLQPIKKYERPIDTTRNGERIRDAEDQPPNEDERNSQDKSETNIDQNNEAIDEILKNGTIGNNYQIMHVIGKGGYGLVVKVKQISSSRIMAVKVFYKSETHDTWKLEAFVMRSLQEGDDSRKARIGRIFGITKHRGRQCLVLELYGISLRRVLSTEETLPLPRRHVKEIAKQLIQGIKYMHGMGMIHADLKPENIVLENDESVRFLAMNEDDKFRSRRILRSSAIKIIDFSCAASAKLRHDHITATPPYRAPEVDLKLGWDTSVDTFSIGCILAELATGNQLFYPSQDMAERLACIEHVLGPFSRNYADKIEQLNPNMFLKKGSRRLVKFDAKDADDLFRDIRPLKEIMQLSSLSNLIRRLLCADPEKRMDLQNAEAHVFFSLNFD